MPNPATIADVENRWRPLEGFEEINATAFLGDAWAELLRHRPALEGDMIAGTVKTHDVIRVLCAMTLRVLRNPDGYDQESLDDWSGRRNALVADGLLRVTPEELAAVTPRRTSHRSSVRLVVYGDA